jgi:quinolinate synthase
LDKKIEYVEAEVVVNQKSPQEVIEMADKDLSIGSMDRYVKKYEANRLICYREDLKEDSIRCL